MINECTVQNNIVLAIFMPKIITIGLRDVVFKAENELKINSVFTKRRKPIISFVVHADVQKDREGVVCRGDKYQQWLRGVLSCQNDSVSARHWCYPYDARHTRWDNSKLHNFYLSWTSWSTSPTMPSHWCFELFCCRHSIFLWTCGCRNVIGTSNAFAVYFSRICRAVCFTTICRKTPRQLEESGVWAMCSTFCTLVWWINIEQRKTKLHPILILFLHAISFPFYFDFIWSYSTAEKRFSTE